MKTKTCGECRFYEHPAGQCAKVIEYNNCHITDKSCEYFEPKAITNGDRIRQGGNRDFAEYFVYETGAVFASTLIADKTFDTYEEAVKATEDYLNAPADDCVKQNGSHDTQPGLCVADNTESEEKDE